LHTATPIIADMTARVETPLAVVVHEPGRVPIRMLVNEAPTEIGRDCHGLLLTDPTISRRHLSVQVVSGLVRVSDLGSTRGTSVDDVELAGSHILQRDEIVRFGRSTVELWTGTTDAASTAPHDTATSIDRLQAIAGTDPPPDLSRLGSAATTFTTVVVDIHHSDHAAAEMSPERWSAAVDAHTSIVRRHSIRARGLELASSLDAFLITFTSASRAVDCMVHVQRAAQAMARSRPADAVHVRSGIHASDVVIRTNPHLFRLHVAVAAGLARAARGGEILVTGIVRELVEPHGSAQFDPPRRLPSRSSNTAPLAHPVRWTPHMFDTPHPI
jgi:class 3 adenylate cyclase